MPSRQPKEECFIYTITHEGGPTKIGHSRRPLKRKTQLAWQTGWNLTITGLYPVGEYIAFHAERYAHWLLRDKHFRGEWFNVTQEEADAAIREAITKNHNHQYPIPPVDLVGREIRGGEVITTKFPARTKDRITALIGPDGCRADLIREAVEAELARRERTSPKPKP